jgi:hypothetical protein
MHSRQSRSPSALPPSLLPLAPSYLCAQCTQEQQNHTLSTSVGTPLRSGPFTLGEWWFTVCFGRGCWAPEINSTTFERSVLFNLYLLAKFSSDLLLFSVQSRELFKRNKKKKKTSSSSSSLSLSLPSPLTRTGLRVLINKGSLENRFCLLLSSCSCLVKQLSSVSDSVREKGACRARSCPCLWGRRELRIEEVSL